MSDSKLQDIQVTVNTTYIASSSEPEAARYVFAYSITIKNTGNIEAQLLSRHWIITDSTGRTEHVQGEGVIGEQPVIDPGKSFRYTSAAPLRTSSGFMGGSYEMRTESGETFAAEIPNFSLDRPYDHSSRH